LGGVRARRVSYFGRPQLRDKDKQKRSRDRRQEDEPRGGEEKPPEDLAKRFMREMGEKLIKDGELKREEIPVLFQEFLRKREKMKVQLEGERKEFESHEPVIDYLVQEGYLKEEGEKYKLTDRSFMEIGYQILLEIFESLRAEDFGLHQTKKTGMGTLPLETTREYEIGDTLRFLDVAKTILNAVERMRRERGDVSFPIEISQEDLEMKETYYETMLAIAYCIDLSSTMMIGCPSRLEAAKKALWALYTLHKKFFPRDEIYIIGFGSLAYEINPRDILYLKAFTRLSLRHTNYQAAFRLASMKLRSSPSRNKRIVMITDGHPSACYADGELLRESERKGSSLWYPEVGTWYPSWIPKTLINKLKRETQLVYRRFIKNGVDLRVARNTISEALKCKRSGIDIDILMISEDKTLLSFINRLKDAVKGKAVYVKPSELGVALLLEYQNQKRIISRLML